MTMAYEGSARLVEIDEDAYASVMDVEGRDAKGQGTASATITNRLQEAADGGTLVRVETDLNVTGRQAQFGRGIMEDVAGRMLGQFAQQLEQLINEGEQPAAAGPAANGGPAPAAASATHGDERARAPRPQSDDDVLDMGSVFGGTVTRNLPIVGGAVAALLLLVVIARALRSPRRSVRFEINL
jgi:hypothetical protein